MSNRNDDIIKRLVTDFNTLQTEYQTKLSLYVSAKESYLQELQKVNAGNPCGSYSLLGTSTNISQDCFSQIWFDQKCTTTAPKVDSTKTFMQLLSEVFTKSKSTTVSDRTACYGPARSTGTDTRIFNTSAGYVANGHDNDFLTQNNVTWVAADNTVATSMTETPTNITNCLQLCAKTSGCTGATYEGTISPKKCTLVNGPGRLVETTPTSPPTKIGIYLKLTSYSTQLNLLNNELLTIITSLETKKAQIQSRLDLVNLDLSSLEGPFKTDYDTLIAEKATLTNLLNSHRDIEAKYNQQNTLANNEKTSLRFWSILAVIIVILIIKYFFGFDSPSINAIFLITIFFVLCLSLSSPSGFAAMGIFLLVFLLLMINNFF